MRFYPGDPDHQPIRYLGRVPVFATTIIVALMAIGMVLMTMIATANGPVGLFIFSTEDFYLHGWVWQMFTAMFVNEPQFFFLFTLFFYYWCAMEIEVYFGRRAFLLLYGLNLATAPLVLGLWHLAGHPQGYVGATEMLIAMFMAYATLYPNLEYFGWVPMKYVAFACLAIAALGYFPHHDWPGLSFLLAECGVSFGFVRYVKQGGSLGVMDWLGKLNPFRRRGKFRVLPTPAGSRPPMDSPSGTSMISVDAILDKIARSGFASLTQSERDQLEKAREILNKKKQ